MCESKKSKCVHSTKTIFLKAAADPSLRPQGNEGSQGSKNDHFMGHICLKTHDAQWAKI